MPKKELFQKLTNYKEQLESILENKDFSTNAENLLFNLLYKIENSYNDYEKVKRIVDDRKTVIENFLKLIKECNDIEIIEPNSSTMNKFKKKKIVFDIDKENRQIRTFPDEKALLEAIYNLEEAPKLYLDEDYSAIRNSLPDYLNNGKKNLETEIIRDFNAWSWNTDLSEIKDTEYSIIYSNLEILLGKEFFNEWINLHENKNAIKILKNELNECFNTEKEIDEFLEILFKLSIIAYCKKDKNEKNRLEEELKINLEELERLKNTEKLIEDITKEKQKQTKEIEKIDKILNNKETLQKELEKAIENEDKFITEEEFNNNLKRKRRKLEKRIKESNKLLDGKYYSDYKGKIEKNIKILKAIKENSKKQDYIIKFQKYFINGLKNKIMSLNNKKDIFNMLYIIRYYNFIPYSGEKFIKDVPELKADINDIEDLLLTKMEENKMLNKFSNIQKFDRKLIKKIFKLRIINLEKISVEFQKGEKIRIIFYDEDTIEKGFEIKNTDIKITKYNKKIKMFS